MKINNYILYILFFVLAACESPLDLDTPRKKLLPNPIDSLPLSVSSISIETNGEIENYLLTNAMLEVDTSKKNPLVWGSLEFQSNIKTNFVLNKFKINTMHMKFTNTPVTGNPILLGTTKYKDSFVRYLISRGVNSLYDKIILSDAVSNKNEISFSLDRENKRIWVYLDAQIRDERVFFTDSSMNQIDSIPDVLFVKGRFQFKY